MAPLFTINWNGGIIPSGDTSQWDAAAQSCFNSRPQIIVLNPTAQPPSPLKIMGPAGSTGDPNSDGNRKITGVVPGTSVVFGT